LSVNWIAVKMLVGDRAKYIGIIMGLTFAALLITQQAGIFSGVMIRTYFVVTEIGLPDIWVTDPKVQFIDDLKPLQDTELYRVRSVGGVEWAVPLYKGHLRARLDNGAFQNCNVLGLDDATLIGGPARMAAGRLADLRTADGVIVDRTGAEGKLARHTPDGRPMPLQVGDSLELNDHRAVVVGICDIERDFQSLPTVYTTYTRATTFAPFERKMLSFVLVKAKRGVNPERLCERIRNQTGLAAYTSEGFKELTYHYYMTSTGVPLNFGVAVALGFIVGTAIAGQTFYNFTLDNLRHFGTFKAMGASDRMLLKMILVQALAVGLIGYGLGVGAASIAGRALAGRTELSFRMPWQLLVGTALAISVICMASAVVSMIKVIRLEPAVVFKS
jgi:putative ABC transport system permease protein